MSGDSRGHVPSERWAFDESVTDVFEDMLARSIPQLDVMRDLVFDIASDVRERSAKGDVDVVDLGASRGDAIARMHGEWEDARFVLVESSEPMVRACERRFIGSPNVDVRQLDLRREAPADSRKLTLSVLTLQFTPINYRHQILRRAFERTVSGGALILVEKVLGGCVETNDLLVRRYHALKERNGYSRDEIDRKAASLEGVLVPVSARWNEEMLLSAGFASVECFWRCLSFVGWVAYNG